MPALDTPSPPPNAVVKDYGRLLQSVTDTADEGKAVRILAEILLDKEGRAFISNLEHKEAELCIEILDHVSRDMPPSPSSAISPMISSGHRQAQPQIRRETGFFRHVEEARRNPRSIARVHDNNRKSSG
jgi:hypothetical protein